MADYEGPPDAQALVPLVAAPGMRPPVALVIYPPEHPGVGVFYPFATFSPEWNAMRYALAHGIPVRQCANINSAARTIGGITQTFSPAIATRRMI